MPLPPEDSSVLVERTQRTLSEGEGAFFDEGGRIRHTINYNGQTYSTELTTEEDVTPSDTLQQFQFTETSIGGANFTLDLGENAVIVRDGNGNQRALFGQITTTGYGLQAKDSSGNELVGLYGTTNKISNWTISPSAFSNSSQDGSKTISLESGLADNQPKVKVIDGSTTMVELGVIGNNVSGLKINNAAGTNVITIDGSGTTEIAGWDFTEDLFRSESTGARIELNANKNRVSIFDANDEKVVMGYLDGLAKNDGSGNWASNDYGFWAKAGDTLQIDGNIEYESGDWMVENDASLKIHDGDGDEIIRLGTYDGDKGLFIGSDIDTTTPLAKYTGSQILIGDESGQHMKYTTANGLEITGDITVTGDTSNNFYSNFQYGDVGSQNLPTSHFAVITGSGGLNQYQHAQGMQFYDSNINQAYDYNTSSWTSDGWDCGWFTQKEFKREDIPTLTWDIQLLKSGGSSSDANQLDSNNDNRFEMIGWHESKNNSSYTVLGYGVYFSRDDAYWYGNGGIVGTIFSNDTSKAGNTYRMVLSLTSTGAVGRLYENGDFTTPMSSQTFTNDSSTTTWYAGALQRNGSSAKLRHQQMAIGNVAPSVPTRISGGLITTGKIQSTDEKTFFDLDNDDLRVNDGSNDRVVVGKLANNNYGMRVAYEGSSASGSPSNDDLMFSTEFALPKYQIIYFDGREKRGTMVGNDVPFPMSFVNNSSNTDDWFYLKASHSDDQSQNSGYLGDGAIRPFNGWAGGDSTKTSLQIGENKINFPYLHDKSLKYIRFSCVAAAGTGVMMSINKWSDGSSYSLLFARPDMLDEDTSNVVSYSNRQTTVFAFAPKAGGTNSSSSDNFNTNNNDFVTGSSKDFSYTYNGSYGNWQTLHCIADVSDLTHAKFYTISINIGGAKLDSNLQLNFKNTDEGFIMQPLATAHGYEFDTSAGTIDF